MVAGFGYPAGSLEQIVLDEAEEGAGAQTRSEKKKGVGRLNNSLPVGAMGQLQARHVRPYMKEVAAALEVCISV